MKKLLQYTATAMCTLFLSSSLYASVAELNAYDVDTCRQQLKKSFVVNFPTVLVYSKDTDAKVLKLFETLAEERPNTPFFKFNHDNDKVYGHEVSRICLGQLTTVEPETFMLVLADARSTYVIFQAIGFGAHSSMFSNKSILLSVIDDSNDTRLKIKR